VILRYLQGLGSAYSIFYTSFTTNNQILLGDDGGEVDFDFVALKAKLNYIIDILKKVTEAMF
jgi:hypothetical protein